MKKIGRGAKNVVALPITERNCSLMVGVRFNLTVSEDVEIKGCYISEVDLDEKMVITGRPDWMDVDVPCCQIIVRDDACRWQILEVLQEIADTGAYVDRYNN